MASAQVYELSEAPAAPANAPVASSGYVCPDCRLPLEDWHCSGCGADFPVVGRVPCLLSRAPEFGRLTASIAASYDSIYSTRSNVWEPQGRTPAFIAFFAAMLDHLEPTRSLEIGCGEGFLLGARRRGEQYAIDLSIEAIQKAKGRTDNARFSLALAERLPFPDGHFDMVASVGVMEHFLDIGAALREILRVLRPGGHYVSLTHVDLTRREKLSWLASRYLLPPRPTALMRLMQDRLRAGRHADHPAQPIQNHYTTNGGKAWLTRSGFKVNDVLHIRSRPDLPLVGPSVVIYAAQK